MEYLVDTLLRAFEQGKMTRRQLIESLAAAVTAAAGTAAPVSGQATRLRAIRVNHISYQVADYRRTRDFYADLLGMTVKQDDGQRQCYLVFGDSFLIPRNRRSGVTPPLVDHIAYTIETWDKAAVEAELKRRGLEPRPDTENSFHVKDPDGFDLQIAGPGMTA
jgi:catechol 2,3-dioxygenase-like lactoylglutathione lyase family enzyme